MCIWELQSRRSKEKKKIYNNNTKFQKGKVDIIEELQIISKFVFGFYNDEKKYWFGCCMRSNNLLNLISNYIILQSKFYLNYNISIGYTLHSSTQPN